MDSVGANILGTFSPLVSACTAFPQASKREQAFLCLNGKAVTRKEQGIPWRKSIRVGNWRDQGFIKAPTIFLLTAQPVGYRLLRGPRPTHYCFTSLK